MRYPGLELERKPWDSDFFGREIYRLSVGEDVSREALDEALSRLDREGVWGVECYLPWSSFGQTTLLEGLGFRLCDSRIVFISRIEVQQQNEGRLPGGTIRDVSDRDLPAVEALTEKAFVDNPDFRSRFKDRTLFSRSESVRYFNAWNRLALEEDPPLFAVWEDQGRAVAFSTYLRQETPEGDTILKEGLSAVDDTHRGHGAQNALQSYLFRRCGLPAFLLDNTTQLSNLPAIRNHIKAGRSLHETGLFYYRILEPAKV